MTQKKQRPSADKNETASDKKTEQGFGGTFLSSLRDYFRSKGDNTSAEDKANEENDKSTKKSKKESKKSENKVRVSKSKGMSLLMKKYIDMARSGLVRENKATSTQKQAVATPTAEKKVDEKKEETSLLDLGDEKKAEDNKGNDSTPRGDDVIDESIADDGIAEDLPIPEFDAGAITDEELEDFIEIPESLLKEAKDLEVMTKNLSKEELEDAANFLGVFKSGGADLERFKDYADRKDEPSKKSDKNAGALSASLSQISAFLSQQKELLSSIGNLSIFNRKNAKKLQKLMDSVDEGDIEVKKKKKQSSSENASDDDMLDMSDVAPEQATKKSEKEEAKEPGDPTDVDNDTLLVTGTTAADEKGATTENELGMEDLSEEERIKRRTQLAEAAEEAEKAAGQSEKKSKKKGLFGFGKKKETVEDIKREGLGIDMEAAIKTPEYKKANAGALKEDLEEEDLLESTTGKKEQDTVPEEKELTAAQKKERARELKKRQKEEEKRQASLAKKQKEEEKRWAEEAKRREALLKKKEEERKKRDKKIRKKGGKVKIVIPKKQKKQGKLKAFLNSLNYMGMGKERVGFIANLGTMMDAGLPLLDALHSLEMEAKNKQMKKLLNRIITAIELGSPLWRAMEAQYFFQPQQVAMVKVGEEAGNLVENLQYLQIQSEKDEALRSKVKTAMIYPIIIFTMLTCIIMGLGIFVLPNLIQVIYSLGVPLPFITRMIIAFTNVFQNHGTVVIPGFFGGVIVFMLLTKYTSFKVVVQWTMYKIPGIGPLLINATLSRFGVVMNGLLQAGLPVTEALDSLASVTPLVRYRKFYYQLLEHIKLGDSFRTSFRQLKLTDKCFPTSVQQLVITGEQSGSLTKIMGKIAEIHDKRAGNIAEKLPVILEPMLLLFIGSLVGGIALGILAPIYSIVGNVG